MAADGRMKMTPKRIVFLVLALLFATFVIQNAQVVEVRFLFWSTQASRALVLLGTFILGLIVGWVARWAWRKGQGSAGKDLFKPEP
jgi:putative membrane protein